MERKGKDLSHSRQSIEQDEQAPRHCAGGAAEGRVGLIHKPGNSQSGKMVFQKM